MSRRTFLRFALAALFAATVVGQTLAQAPAPMPRAMPVCNDSGQFMFSGSYITDLPAPPLCAFDRVAIMARQATPVTQHDASDIRVGYFLDGYDFGNPPINLESLQPPMPRAIAEIVGNFNTAQRGTTWVVGLAPPPPICSPQVATNFPHPLAGVTTVRWDEAAGGWWVESVRMPLPRPTARPVVLRACCDEKPEAVGGKQDCVYGAATGGACGATIGTAVGRSEPAACCEKAGKLAGTWYREVAGMVMTATFAGDELKVCLTQRVESGHVICYTLTADYAVTKERVHGVVTGFDVDVQGNTKPEDVESLGGEIAEMAAELQQFVDTPFALRIRQTSGGLMVSNLKAAGKHDEMDELLLACGMYKFAADGKVPALKPLKKVTTAPECRKADVVATATPDAVSPMSPPTPPGEVVPMTPPADGRRDIKELIFGGTTLPSPRQVRQVEHCPQYFTPGVLVNEYSTDPRALEHRPQYLPLPSQPLMPPKPANVPAGDFGMMADVFGQMMTAQTAPPPVPCPVQPAALSQPAPRMLVVSPQAAAMPPARSLTGTWVREVGPMVYVIKIAGDHITMTATGATEFEDGKVATDGITLTADYHMMRDGTTLLGLVTGVDAILDGDLPGGNELFDMQESLDRMQKALTDKPLAMSVRLYGDTLVIGNVRMPEYHFRDNAREEALFPMSSFGGRYKSIGDRATPKPKVVKLSDMQKLTPPPGPIYGPPPGVFGPPPFVDGPAYLPPPLPCPSRTPPGVAPAQPVIAAGPYLPQPVPSDRIPPPTPRVNEVPPPPAPMTPPTPPVVDQPKEEKKGKKKKKNDAPSHLTPERIHGGILMP